MLISRNGYARIRPHSPRASAACDRCGCLFLLDDLAPQMEWSGSQLIDTGYRVCRQFCLDRPNQQNRSVILPPDPVPRRNPRPPLYWTPQSALGQPLPTTPANQGFTQYVVNGVGGPDPDPTAPNPLTTKSGVLAAIAALSGVAAPAALADQSTTISAANTALPLLPAATTSARTYLLIYNPSAAVAQIALGTTTAWGVVTNLAVGPGEAFFWATAQGLGAVTQSALTCIGLLANAPLWCWDDGGFAYLRDGYGNIVVDGNGNPIVT